MKLIKTDSDNFQFHLAPREKELLQYLLNLYPLIPAAHQKLSKSSALPASDQALLEDALSESRTENKKQLQALLAEPGRLSPVPHGWCLTLKPGDLDWLLQVLNDVRVGSWIALGSPEDLGSALTSENAPHFWTMEAAGYFQMRILEVFKP